MFARTSRLLLRPAWAEDATMVASVIADRAVRDALLRGQADPILPSLLIFERTGGAPLLVGAGGLRRRPSGAVELFVWIAPEHGARDFSAEASQALLGMARAIGVERLELAPSQGRSHAPRPNLRLAAQRQPLAA